MLLSVIIPAYNESGRIGDSLEKINSFLESKTIDFEVIVVDDGSSDDTTSVVKESALYKSGRVKLFSNSKNRGKGYSVRKGVDEANGELILFTDADLSTPIYELDNLQTSLDSGFDIAIGSRSIAGSKVSVRQPLYRQTMGRIFNSFIRLFVGETLVDTQCGFKLFKRDAAKNLFQRSKIDGFAFDVEILYMARKENYKVSEVGIEWLNSPESKVHPIFSSLQMMFDVIKMRFLHR